MMIFNTCLPICFLLMLSCGLMCLKKTSAKINVSYKVFPATLSLALLFLVFQYGYSSDSWNTVRFSWHWLNGFDGIRLDLRPIYSHFRELFLLFFFGFIISLMMLFSRHHRQWNQQVLYLTGVLIGGSLILSTHSEFLMISAWTGIFIFLFALVYTTKADEEIFTGTALQQLVASFFSFALFLFLKEHYQVSHIIVTSLKRMGQPQNPTRWLILNMLLFFGIAPGLGLFPFRNIFSRGGKGTWFDVIHSSIVIPLGLAMLFMNITGKSSFFPPFGWTFTVAGVATVIARIFHLYFRARKQDVLSDLTTATAGFFLIWLGSPFGCQVHLSFSWNLPGEFIVFFTAIFLTGLGTIISGTPVAGHISEIESDVRILTSKKYLIQNIVFHSVFLSGMVMICPVPFRIINKGIRYWTVPHHPGFLIHFFTDGILFFTCVFAIYLMSLFIFKKNIHRDSTYWISMSISQTWLIAIMTGFIVVFALFFKVPSVPSGICIEAMMSTFHKWRTVVLTGIIIWYVLIYYIVRWLMKNRRVHEFSSQDSMLFWIAHGVVGLPLQWLGRSLWYLDGWIDVIFTDFLRWCITKWSEVSLIFDRWFFSMLSESILKKTFRKSQQIAVLISVVSIQKSIFFIIVFGLLIFLWILLNSM